MKVGWIYPFRKRCGINHYAVDYIDILKNRIEIISLNPQEFIMSPLLFKKEIEKCDIVHIQYETSLFRKGYKDYYISLVNNIKVPLIVTLHEVYEQDPFVYPREKIKGFFLLSLIKKSIWNLLHPLQCSFLLHLSKNFRASKILVHHYYHRDILIKKGVTPSLIEIFPIYIRKMEHNNKQKETELFEFPIKLGYHGFINPTYNYELLFSVLSELKIPWEFRWIGGLRVKEHRDLLKEIIYKISRNGWKEKFKITGWLTEKEVTVKLMETDIILALFKIRSTSSSIARALGCYKPVIASDIPLVREIADNLSEGCEISPVIIARQETEDIVEKINRLVKDREFILKLRRSIYKFTETYSIERMAERLINLYREMSKI